MNIKISWKAVREDLTWESVRRIKLVYYVNDEPYGLVMKSMFITSESSFIKSSLTSPARDAAECAIICLMNDECQHFEYSRRSNHTGTCLLAYSTKNLRATKCQNECYEIRKSKETLL